MRLLYNGKRCSLKTLRYTSFLLGWKEESYKLNYEKESMSN